MFARTVWVLKQSNEHLDYTAFLNNSSNDQKVKDDLKDLLSDHLRLKDDLASLYQEWSDKDPHFKKAAVQCYGIRMLKQDPVENVFSFICSSNNNITR